MQPKVIYRIEAGLRGDGPHLNPIAVTQLHLRSDRGAIRATGRTSEKNLDPATASRVFVPQQRRSFVHVDDEHVQVAVVVVVSESGPATRVRGRQARACLVDQFLEAPVPEIAEDHVGSLVRIVRQLGLDFRVNAPGNVRQVRHAVVVEIGDRRAPADEPSFDAQSGLDRLVVEHSRAVIAIENVGVVGEVRLEQVQIAVEIVIANSDSHARLLESVLAQGDAPFQALLLKRPVTEIAKQQARSSVAGQIEIHPSVAVKIRGNRGHAIPGIGSVDPSARGDILERTVAAIAVQTVTALRKPARAAIHRHALPRAVRPRSLSWCRFGIEVEIIRYEQVQQTVAVVVQERGTSSPADFRLRQSGLLRDIYKGTVPAIPIEHVAPPERDVHVLISVVVVIAYSRTGRPAHPSQSRFGSRLLEPSVSEVSMQLQRAFRWGAIKPGAAHD